MLKALNSVALFNPDSDAPSQGEADVLLGPVSKLSGAQNVLPGHQVQQKQHGSTSQVVLQL